jgi:Uma2 family endonuclease
VTIGQAKQLPAAMTAGEFLDWNPPGRWQLIDGTPQAMARASPKHGAIQAEAARIIRNHLAERLPGCRVVIEAGVQPKVHADSNVREPDVAVTCAEWGADAKVLPEPLLLIEILPPSNKTETWANVWSYVGIPSVAEILVLHTAEFRAQLLRRDQAGDWPDNPTKLTLGDDVELASIGFTVTLGAFYRTA